LVLTPAAYQWLTLKRKKTLDHSLVLLSETKSLDFLLHLPRFIEEVGRKATSSVQNERLQRLVEQRIPNRHRFGTLGEIETTDQHELVEDLLATSNPKTHQCGLKLKLKTWSEISASLEQQLNPKSSISFLV